MKRTDNLDVVVDSNGLFAMSYHAAAASSDLKYDKNGYLIAAFKCFFSALRSEIRVPERIIFVFDGKPKTKKPRPPKPADWYEKLDRFQRLIQDAFGSNAYVLHPEHEADDTVATVATRAAAQNRHVTVVSGDKDLQQIWGSNISYYSLGRKRMIKEQEILEKWAIHQPVQVAVALAIIGDKADGINGVDKMGEGAVMKIFKTIPRDAPLDEVVSRVIRHMKTETQLSQFYESLEYTLLKLDVETDAMPVSFDPLPELDSLGDTRAGDTWAREVAGLDPDKALADVEDWVP
jgi:5'-3' exonuclease